MSMWNYFDTRARRLGILDTKLAQAAAIFAALVVVKLIPQIMKANVWWFVAFAALCSIKPFITFFLRHAESNRTEDPRTEP